MSRKIKNINKKNALGLKETKNSEEIVNLGIISLITGISLDKIKKMYLKKKGLFADKHLNS